MHSESGKINYWPGFVDAFSNLVLALVFVIVVLAMSLGMFGSLMAKMAVQRALVEQLRELKAVSAGKGEIDEGTATEAAGGGLPPALPDTADAGSVRDSVVPTVPEPAEAPRPVPVDPAAVVPVPRDSTAPQEQDPAAAVTPDGALRAGSPASEARTVPVDGNTAAEAERAALRRENEVLREENANLRKKNAALLQPETPARHEAKATKPAPSGEPKPTDKFGPTLPEGDRQFVQSIEDELQRALKQLENQPDSRDNINVMIYVPNYALTENRRTALFYLISIKDYLMKRNISSARIRMQMTQAPVGQKDMSVSVSVER